MLIGLLILISLCLVLFGLYLTAIGLRRILHILQSFIVHERHVYIFRVFLIGKDIRFYELDATVVQADLHSEVAAEIL
jgi:hypothetical protein